MPTLSSNTGLPYVLYQDNRETSRYNGQYYARSKMLKTVTFEGLIDHIAEHASTFSRAEVAGVMYQLQDCIMELLQQGNRVQLGNLGSFSLTLQSKPAETIEAFNVNTNVVGIRLRFLPSRTKRSNLSSRSIKDSTKLIYWTKLLTDNEIAANTPSNNAGTNTPGGTPGTGA